VTIEVNLELPEWPTQHRNSAALRSPPPISLKLLTELELQQENQADRVEPDIKPDVLLVD
jgi:hypothetical protein